MNKSNLGDSQILNHTIQATNEQGHVQLRYDIPGSGRRVTSEWIPKDKLKGKVLIQWCEEVRGQDNADIQDREEQELAAKRKRIASLAAQQARAVHAPSLESSEPDYGSAVVSAETSRASSSPSSLPDDPGDLVGAKLQGLRIRLAEVQDQLSELTLQEQQLRASITRWETVASSLQEQSDEPA